MFRAFSNARGSVLLLALVAVAIGSIIFGTVFQWEEERQSELSQLYLLENRDAYARYLDFYTDCGKTLIENGCPHSDPITLRNSAGIAFDTGNQFQTWKAVATCSANEIFVRVARPRTAATLYSSTDAAQFLPDPLTGIAITWQDPKAELYPGGRHPCSAKGPYPETVVEERSLSPVPAALTRQVTVGDSVTLLVVATAVSDTIAAGNNHYYQKINIRVGSSSCSLNEVDYPSLPAGFEIVTSASCMFPLESSASAYPVEARATVQFNNDPEKTWEDNTTHRGKHLSIALTLLAGN